MTPRLQKLFDAIQDLKPVERLGEITVETSAADYIALCEKLRDQHGFAQLIDLANGLPLWFIFYRLKIIAGCACGRFAPTMRFR
jgi:hypothetical protein